MNIRPAKIARARCRTAIRILPRFSDVSIISGVDHVCQVATGFPRNIGAMAIGIIQYYLSIGILKALSQIAFLKGKMEDISVFLR
jgi:hypothetical protein